MEGVQKIFKPILFAIIFIVLVFTFWEKNKILAIILLIFSVLEIYLFIIAIKYHNYFNIQKPAKWSEIKCNACGFQGKPLRYEPKFSLFWILHIAKFVDYYIKQYPIDYGCPNCKNPRKNYKNIEFINK